MRNPLISTVVSAFVLFAVTGLRAQDTSLADIDSDSDGKVTVSEFKDYASGPLSGFDRLDAFIEAVDADSNGEISEAEFADRFNVLQKLTSTADDEADSEMKDKDASAGGEQENLEPGAKKAFEDIKALIAKDKWEEASKLMTKKAQDELVIEQAISAIGLTSMDIDFPIPQMEDTIDEIENVLIEHGLSDLNIDTSTMFKFQMSMGDDSDDEDKEELTQDLEKNRSSMEEQGEKILKHVNKSGKRWKIVKDLWDAKKSSPFSMSPLSGKIEKLETEKGMQFLHVTMAPSSSGDNGVVIQMVGPPAVLRMKKIDGDWKLDGRDEKRTAAAMKKFMKNMPSMPQADQREDF